MTSIAVSKISSSKRKVAIKFIQDVKDRRRLFDELTGLQKIR